MSMSPSGRKRPRADEPNCLTSLPGIRSSIRSLTLEIGKEILCEGSLASLAFLGCGTNIVVELIYLVMEPQERVPNIGCLFGHPRSSPRPQLAYTHHRNRLLWRNFEPHKLLLLSFLLSITQNDCFSLCLSLLLS